MNLRNIHLPLHLKTYFKLHVYMTSVAIPLRNSEIGIVTGYRLDNRGSGIFSPPRHPDRAWGPPSLLSNGYREAVSPGVKRLGREADHSPPASAEIKKIWICTSTHPYAFTV
jgi:hypothetical protein